MRIHGTANKSLGSMSPLALILSGQPELKYRMKLLSLRAIGQCINVRFHLSGLSEEKPKTMSSIAFVKPVKLICFSPKMTLKRFIFFLLTLTFGRGHFLNDRHF